MIAPPPDLVRRFGDVSLIRQGAQFTVYEGTDELGRAVAIKTPDEARPTWVHDMLRRQAELLTSIADHPNVITLYDSITLADGRPALVLDRCVATLAETEVGRRMPLHLALALGGKLADALDTVHRAGVLHCDVRPASVLLTSSGEPVLAAFDEVVSLRAGAPRYPQHVVTAYTAPELLEGAEPVPATDVYGLAATLYELISGQPAFRQYDGESAATVIVRVLSTPVQPVVAADIPLEVSDLLTWALAADPAARPPSPAWFAEELGRLRSQLGLVV